MRISLIYNPAAGGADRIREFVRCLTNEHRCELRPTNCSDDIRRFAREALADGFERIVVAGGDGTMNQVVNGLGQHCGEIQLGILPFGTGNDLARSLGLSSERFSTACEVAVGAHIATIDILRITSSGESFYCVNVANGGLGGQVTANVRPEDKQRWGPMAYWMQSVSRLIDLQAFDIHLSLDNRPIDVSAYGVAIANGRFVGGGFPIAPRARLNDGYLDVTIVPVLPMFELMAAGLNFALGREERKDRVQHYQARRAELVSKPHMPISIDGESTHAIDVAVEVIPDALRVAVAEDAPGLAAPPESGPFFE